MDIAAFEPASLDYPVQQLARPADKRSALGVFVGARGLSDEHYPSIRTAFTGDCIGSQRPQVALAALRDLLGQLLKLSRFLGNCHIILLFLLPARTGLGLDGEAGKELLGLKMLANNLTDIHVFFHCGRF
jgi:hypothetical protein